MLYLGEIFLLGELSVTYDLVGEWNRLEYGLIPELI